MVFDVKRIWLKGFNLQQIITSGEVGIFTAWNNDLSFIRSIIFNISSSNSQRWVGRSCSSWRSACWAEPPARSRCTSRTWSPRRTLWTRASPSRWWRTGLTDQISTRTETGESQITCRDGDRNFFICEGFFKRALKRDVKAFKHFKIKKTTKPGINYKSNYRGTRGSSSDT